jgi:crooked neck
MHLLDLDWDLVFADDERESNPTSFKFLQMAHAWKQAQAAGGKGTAVLSGFTPAAAKPGNDEESSDEES